MQKVRFSRHPGFARVHVDKEQPMKVRQLRDLTDAELQNRLAETRQELFNLRFQSATGALENSARLRLAKREIARILTIRHEREDALERNH